MYTPDRLKQANKGFHKALTNAILRAIRERRYRDAYLDLISLAYAPTVPALRVRRLRNVLVTWLRLDLRDLTPRYDYARVTCAAILERAERLSIGWLAVEGGAA